MLTADILIWKASNMGLIYIFSDAYKRYIHQKASFTLFMFVVP